MSERYWITGVQLGIIKALTQKGQLDWDCQEEIHKLIDDIIDKQFIVNREVDIIFDKDGRRVGCYKTEFFDCDRCEHDCRVDIDGEKERGK